MHKKRMLVAYSMSATLVQTTLDYLLMLQEHLPFDTEYVHVTHDAIMGFDINRYDIVFNSYCARHCFDGYVSQGFVDALRSFRGLKVMAVQDEYDRTDTLKAAIKELGFHVVLTCVPQASLACIYPRTAFPDVEFMTVFTGYVSQSLIERSRTAKPLAERKIVVGYRGRDIGGRYGRLAFDKYEIGRRMKEECDARSIANDIAMDEESRIYGTAWFDFVESCRAMLGSESGANVFDFDGSVERKYRELTAKRNGRAPSYAEFEPYIAERERAIDMGQISPRVFEAAALRTPMVLYRGRYSDAIEPETHYIALEKDFSNVETVLKRLEDLPALEAMADRAYNDLIASGTYTYAAFCERLLKVIERGLQRLREAGPAATPAGSHAAATEGASTAQQRALVEHPTATPLGQSDFQEKILRKDRALYDAEVRRLDASIEPALASYDRTLSEILRSPHTNRESAAVRDAVAAYRASRDALVAARAAFRSRTADLLAEETLLVAQNRGSETNRIEARLSAAAKEWIGLYNETYQTCRHDFEAALAAAQDTHGSIRRVAPAVKRRLVSLARTGFARLPEAARRRIVAALSLRNKRR